MHSSTIAKAPACFGGFGVGHEFLFVALHFVAAERVDALRPQAAVGHDGDAGADQGGDRFGLFDAPFELHGLAASFLQDAARVFDRAVGAEVEARERHVDDHERVLDGAADHFGVVDHFVERHGQRAVVSLHDHRHAVADQNAFDAGGIDEPRERVVVGRDHRDLASGRFEAGEFRDG